VTLAFDMRAACDSSRCMLRRDYADPDGAQRTTSFFLQDLRVKDVWHSDISDHHLTRALPCLAVAHSASAASSCRAWDAWGTVRLGFILRPHGRSSLRRRTLAHNGARPAVMPARLKRQWTRRDATGRISVTASSHAAVQSRLLTTHRSDLSDRLHSPRNARIAAGKSHDQSPMELPGARARRVLMISEQTLVVACSALRIVTRRGEWWLPG
jgi:hypothetical protein